MAVNVLRQDNNITDRCLEINLQCNVVSTSPPFVRVKQHFFQYIFHAFTCFSNLENVLRRSLKPVPGV